MRVRKIFVPVVSVASAARNDRHFAGIARVRGEQPLTFVRRRCHRQFPRPPGLLHRGAKGVAVVTRLPIAWPMSLARHGLPRPCPALFPTQNCTLLTPPFPPHP